MVEYKSYVENVGILTDKDKYQEAIIACKDALNEIPNILGQPKAFFCRNMAYAYNKRGDYRNAIAACERGLAIRNISGQPKAFFCKNMAYAHIALGEYRYAIIACERGLAIRSISGQSKVFFYRYMAYAYSELGDYYAYNKQGDDGCAIYGYAIIACERGLKIRNISPEHKTMLHDARGHALNKQGEIKKTEATELARITSVDLRKEAQKQEAQKALRVAIEEFLFLFLRTNLQQQSIRNRSCNRTNPRFDKILSLIDMFRYYKKITNSASKLAEAPPETVEAGIRRYRGEIYENLGPVQRTLSKIYMKSNHRKVIEFFQSDSMRRLHKVEYAAQNLYPGLKI